MRSTALFFSTLLLAAAPAAAQDDFPSDSALASMLRYIVEDGETPGIVVGVLEADGSTRVLAHGTSGPDAPPLSPQSVFEIGSVTKTFTGSLLAALAADGVVALDDPVAKHLPAEVDVPSAGGRQITLLDLATHTSGLPRVPTGYIPADLSDPYADLTVDTLYGWLSQHELRRTPGSEYEYSNLGMGLLGHALAWAAGMPLDSLMRTRILEPLGMRSTRYGGDAAQREQDVRGHGPAGVMGYWSAPPAVRGAGGLLSTARDLLAYVDANVGPAATPLEEAMRSAHTPRRPTDDERERIGLAWFTTQANGRTIVHHSGTSGGFRAQVAFDPERRIGVVVLANSSAFGDNLYQELLLMPRVAERPEVAPEPATLAPLAGEYLAGGRLPLYIRFDDRGYLTGQAPNQIRFRLYATSDSTFYAKRVPFEITFVRGEDGAVDHLVLGVGDRTNRFERIGDDVPPPRVVAGNETR